MNAKQYMFGQTLGQIPNLSVPNIQSLSQMGDNGLGWQQVGSASCWRDPFPQQNIYDASSYQYDYCNSDAPKPPDFFDVASTGFTEHNMVITKNTDQLHFVKGEPLSLPNATFVKQFCTVLVLGLIIFFCRKYVHVL